MATAPFKSNSNRLTAIVSFAVALIALLAIAGTSSAADRGWTSTGDIQNVHLQVHNGLVAPDDDTAEQFQISVINYNSFAVNGKVKFYALKDGQPTGKPVAEGGFQLPADGPTTAIALSSDKLIKLVTGKKFKSLKVKAKISLWTNGYTKTGKAEGKYTIVKKLKGQKGAANALPTADNISYKVKEGATLSGPIFSLLSGAKDADFDHLYLRVTQRPTHFKTFTIGADGVFTYVGAANFAGTDSFVFDIFDGTGYSAPVTVNLTITAIAPKIATIADVKFNGGDQLAAQTASIKSAVTGSPAITYELTGTPPAGVTINATSGVITVPSGLVLAGTYSVSVKATNPGGSTTKAFKIIVKPGKNGTIGNQTNDTNDVVNITTAANFTTAPGATYSATGLPSGLSIDAGGVITGTPDTIGGPSNVVVTATDVNGTASQSFTWTVTAP
jgi:hypothetical protein